MTHQVEQQIRERAYHLWVGAGMAEGRDRDYWLAAEQEILTMTDETSVAASPKSRKKAPVKATTIKSAKAKKAMN